MTLSSDNNSIGKRYSRFRTLEATRRLGSLKNFESLLGRLQGPHHYVETAGRYVVRLPSQSCAPLCFAEVPCLLAQVILQS